MKLFRMNYGYKGRYFDIEFCCKTVKEACDRMGVSYHEMKTYHGTGMKIKDNEVFDNIKAVAYSHNAVVSIGHRDEIDFEEAKKIIDNEKR